MLIKDLIKFKEKKMSLHNLQCQKKLLIDQINLEKSKMSKMSKADIIQLKIQLKTINRIIDRKIRMIGL